MKESAHPHQAGPASPPSRRSSARSAALTERLRATLDYDELTNCMRCGFCQPSCPTFVETGLEAASPRGRIALMKAVVDGVMEPDEAFRDQMDLCLGCRACEPVCPADVKYGHLLEQTRDTLEAQPAHRWWVKGMRAAAFRHLFPKQRRMYRLGAALRFYQRSGIRRAVRKSGMLKALPLHLRQMEAIMPEASGQGVAVRLGAQVPAKGAPIAKVGMFRGCLMDMMFTDTNVRTVELLAEAGFEVVIPETQNCCGALHAHSGELEQARELARRNVRAFREAGVDYIVSNAGGCGALLVEYGHLLGEDDAHKEDAAWFAARVIDVSALLHAKGRLPAFASAGEAVTVQDSCHLRNVMRTAGAPRHLLGRVEGARLVEMAGADSCCGSAGIYNLVQPQMSMDILDRKMEQARATNAHVIVTSNPGCLLQMKLGIEREGLGDRMEAVHIVDYLHRTMVRA